uniref:Uncharacterized protein n=1 Tax=Rhizophora mucronata TaxID=61149 RepID=A0A2P2NJJ5_RHIMU
MSTGVSTKIPNLIGLAVHILVLLDGPRLDSGANVVDPK